MQRASPGYLLTLRRGRGPGVEPAQQTPARSRGATRPAGPASCPFLDTQAPSQAVAALPAASPSRSPSATRSRPRLREARRDAHALAERLEQRHLDMIGLGLVAAGVYLGFVLYVGWDGGPVGEWLKRALENAAGRIAYVAPLALAGWGLALVMRPFVAAPGALNAGGVLLLASLLLAFAAQTAGLGPDHPIRHGYFEQRFFTVHGGAAGEALYWAATTLFQRLGAQILAVLMFASGLLLLTGTTVAGLMSRAGRVARTAGTGTRDLAKTVRSGGLGLEGLDPRGDEIEITRADPTEPLATGVLGGEPDAGDAQTATAGDPRHGEWADEDVEGPDTDYDEAAAGEVGAPDAADADVVAGDDAPQVARTPMGNKREGVTASEELDYELPTAKLLQRGKGDPGPDVKDREAVAKALLEALRHFGVEAKLLGVVSGPHVSRYELQLAPGTKVGKVAQLRDDLAYALASTDIRILAPIPGKKAVGVEVPNQRRRLVRLGDIYDGLPKGSSPLAVWLGKDVSGQAVWADLAPMPHALVAGTTGSGKSGCINAMLCSVLLACVAERGPPGAGRPEAGRAEPLRAPPAPADPGGHEPTPGRQRARQPDRRDGEPLRRHGRGAGAEPDRAQPRPPQGRPGAAAVHPLRDRRAGGPDDDRAGRRRGLDHPAGAEVAGRRHPPGAGHAAAVDRRDHGNDQGQHPGSDRLLGRLAGRLARDPRPGRGRDPAGPGGHAVPAGGDLEARSASRALS